MKQKFKERSSAIKLYTNMIKNCTSVTSYVNLEFIIISHNDKADEMERDCIFKACSDTTL